MGSMAVLRLSFLLAAASTAGGAVALEPPGKPPIDAVVRKAADALGMVRWDDYARGPERENLDLINRFEIVASGTGHEVRRSGAWPAYQIKQLVMGVSLLTPAVRQELIREVGGKETRSIQVVRGNLAWDESEPGIGGVPASGAAAERLRQIYLLPQGFLRAVLQSPASDVEVSKNAAGNAVLSVRINGAMARATLNQDYRPATIELPVTDRVLGRTTLKVELSGYKDFEGYEVFFPTHIVQTLQGRPLLTLDVSKEMTGVYLAFPVPASLKSSDAATAAPSRHAK